MVKKFFKTTPLKTYYPNSDLEGPIFSYGKMGCLDENTEIYVFEDRLYKKKLCDLPEKFKVVSYNFKRKKQEIKDAVKIDSGEKKCFEIELENGKTMIASEDHVFFDEEGKEIKVKDLVDGNKLLSFSAISGFNKTISWCKGKTKQDFPQLTRDRSRYHGWNKGLTKETDPRVSEISRKKKGKPRLDIIGENNPAKRPEVRKKISEFLRSEGNGMRGKHHSEKTKQHWKSMHRAEGQRNCMKREDVKIKHGIKAKLVGKRFREQKTFAGKNNPMFGKVAYPKRTFVPELGFSIRSSWEKEICLKLAKSKISFEYEPEAFKLVVDGINHTYTPDIRVDNVFIEIKGPLFEKALKKMIEFSKTHNLVIITGKCNIKKLQGFKVFDYEKVLKEDFDANEMLKN